VLSPGALAQDDGHELGVDDGLVRGVRVAVQAQGLRGRLPAAAGRRAVRDLGPGGIEQLDRHDEHLLPSPRASTLRFGYLQL
jgi:hypothetical protein